MTFALYVQGTVSRTLPCRIHLKDPTMELATLSEEHRKSTEQGGVVKFTWEERNESFDTHRPELTVPCIVIEWTHDDVMAGYELFGVVEDSIRGINRSLSLRKFMQKIDGEDALQYVLSKAKDYSYALQAISTAVDHAKAGRKNCDQALEEISQLLPLF